ncbi:F-box protein At5g49610-like [Chenopodium quinoa]|uniref:F-box protein At5g49610-like n=1 Tax=Chenopodium quinoa TaxID=63459 RepID=UPI000B78E7A7|nr:F-box protein At5g49610-like [Chenopodium quinoa]
MHNLPIKWPTRKRSIPGQQPSPPPSQLPPSLSDDVLIEILKRLPLKSLVRFICICKSWFSLLTSPSFMSILAAFNSKKSQKFLLFKEPIYLHCKANHTMFFAYDSDNLTREFDRVFPFTRSHFVVSSADGLLCLYNFYDKHQNKSPLILWNPSIKKHRVVDVPPIEVQNTAGGFPKLIFGFGFDSCSCSYKVVRVSYSIRYTGNCFLSEVYSISDGEWSCLGLTKVPYSITTIRWRGMCLNGVVHWICNLNVNLDTDPNDRVYRMIWTLALGNGESGEIMLPKELVNMPDGSLRVVMVPRNGKEVLGVIHIRDDIFSLWVMENYGVKAVKLFSVNFYDSIKNDMNVLVISDHEVVVKTMRDGWLSYDHNLQQIQSLETKLTPRMDYVDTYEENLFLVGQNSKRDQQDSQEYSGVKQDYLGVKRNHKKVWKDKP